MKSQSSIPRREFVVKASLAAASLAVTGAAWASEQSPTSATRLYRREPDSSGLKAPRVFSRVFCEPAALAGTVKFYESLAAVSLDQDMDIPDAGLHVVAVGPFLILALDPKKLDANKHGQATETHTTVLVAHLDETAAGLVAKGATIVQPRWTVPPGAGIRLRHPDGLLVEYIEHRPSAFDVDQPSAIFR